MLDISIVKKLSTEEKLQVMEAIWQDLTEEEQNVQSPAWHLDALKETEKRRAEGKEAVLDWGDAKRELRKRFE
ncbi:putative addiction module component [delta proteobacterium NaphS2]|nr:putative addiction module component [delta proteobacterium NaphS2]